MLIVLLVFDENGFGSWKHAMTITLSTKSKLYFVDGTLTKARTDSPNMIKWVTCNDMVISWILNA